MTKGRVAIQPKANPRLGARDERVGLVENKGRDLPALPLGLFGSSRLRANQRALQEERRCSGASLVLQLRPIYASPVSKTRLP